MIDPLEIRDCGRFLAGFDEQLSDDGLSPALGANELLVPELVATGGRRPINRGVEYGVNALIEETE